MYKIMYINKKASYIKRNLEWKMFAEGVVPHISNSQESFHLHFPIKLPPWGGGGDIIQKKTGAYQKFWNNT